MRIDNKPPTFITDATDISNRNNKTSSADRNVSKSSSQPQVVSIAKDEMHISSSQRLLKEIKEQLITMPDSREDLIKDLRHRFETDTYTVSGKEIATKIVNTAYNKLF